MQKTVSNLTSEEVRRPGGGKPSVEFIRVSKIYRPNIVALQNVSLSIPRGEMVFLCGMSGAGKSTLLKLICNMEKPSRGVVEVAGQDIARLKSDELQMMRQKIGFAYQDFKLLPHLTVFENISMAMEVAYRSPNVIRRRIQELTNLLLLNDRINTPAGKLSRGEQQRVAIARAAANAPPLVLADEPTGNLDAKVTAQVMELFRQLNDAGATVIIATHDESIYRGKQHRVFELHNGHLRLVHGPAQPPVD